MPKFSRARIAAVASTTALALAGGALTAPSASALGLPDIINMLSSGASGSSNAPAFTPSNNPVVDLGRAGGPLFNASFSSQVTTPGATGGIIAVRPGQTFTIRIASTSEKPAFIYQLGAVVPQNFELKSVVVPQQNLLGATNAVQLNPSDYSVSVQQGQKVVSVSPKDKFLKLFDIPGEVKPGKSVFVDFTFAAPQQVGLYPTGGLLEVGSLLGPAAISPTNLNVAGGSKINVTNNAAQAPTNAGSLNVGSLSNLGSS